MDDQSLCEIVLALIVYAKDDHDYCVTLGNEIAALRDALDEISQGRFLPILERHRKRMREIASELKVRDSSVYDELILKLKGI